mmetsp:Transcript_6331/g.12076  ORF Transcript_6331/g.12076 Transcript_6331/m.12076 type:complete len:189 (+) Transcript_6331:76-642(+)
MDMKIGAHCADPTCNQLDFLPWRCRGCSELFCAEHNAAHSCAQTAQLEAEEDRWAVECPLCNRNVAAMPGETRDTAVSRHMERGCKPRKARKHRCAVRGCKTKEMISVRCRDCTQQVCFAHRNPDTHACGALPAPTPAPVAVRSAGASCSAAARGCSTAATAATRRQAGRNGRLAGLSRLVPRLQMAN